MTAYALAVVAGDIVAGPHVRAACRRHLDDMEKGAERGLVFVREAAEDFFDFCAEMCTVLKDKQVVPLILSPAQKFKYGSIFGWKRAATGRRRFQTAYIEEGKGNGKSPGAAAVGLYMLVGDGEERAEVYAAATKKDQAMILFRDAVSMVNNSPVLSTNLVKSGGNPVWQLTYHPTASWFKPISNDDGQSGPRPHCGIVDELHEVKDRYTVDMLEAGFKFRTEPLLFMITNSGFDLNTVCGEYHDLAIKVANQEVEDDQFFAYVCALDDGDDPLTDESCWVKANPELGNVLPLDYLRKQVAAARSMPSKLNLVLRLNFCVWTDAPTAWMSREAWMACEKKPPHRKKPLQLEDFKGAKAHAALDLSFRTDLSAEVLTFDETIAGKLHIYAFARAWTPGATVSLREFTDKVPYSAWIRDGFLTATPGKVIPMEIIARQLERDMHDFDLEFVAYDRYRHKELREEYLEMGFDIPMIEHPQGFRRAGRLSPEIAARFGYYDDEGKPCENPLWMPTSIETWEHAIIEGRFWTPPNPVFRWNVAGVTPRADPAGTGGKVFDKRRATGRIDVAVAGAMAVGAKVAKFSDASDALDDWLANPVMVK